MGKQEVWGFGGAESLRVKGWGWGQHVRWALGTLSGPRARLARSSAGHGVRR